MREPAVSWTAPATASFPWPCDGEMGYVYGGCGIVGESDADAEYEEIDLKLRTILSAFGA